MTQSLPLVRVAMAVVALGTLAPACGPGRPQELAATGAWARPTPATATNGVIYLTIETDVDDALVDVAVSTTVAGSARMHATTIDGGSEHHHGATGGSGASASMEELGRIPVTPDKPLVFEPGGNHIMLNDLPDPLVLGEEFTLTLGFSSGRSLDVAVVVADNPPG